MHELQLFRQVVKVVGERCQARPATPLALIRLAIGSYSHLASHTPEELQVTFQFAAKGTLVESAALDISIQPSQGICQACQTVFSRGPETYGCPQCCSGNIAWDDHPELVITEIEFIEQKS